MLFRNFLSKIKYFIFVVEDFFIIDLILERLEKDNPTLALDLIFKSNNYNFLKNYFQISTQTLNSIESKTPLIDLLVEKASILI